MSKKDLLERISRASTDRPVTRRTETTATARGDSVTTRVNRRVVRRRRRADPVADAAPEAAPPATEPIAEERPPERRRDEPAAPPGTSAASGRKPVAAGDGTVRAAEVAPPAAEAAAGPAPEPAVEPAPEAVAAPETPAEPSAPEPVVDPSARLAPETVDEAAAGPATEPAAPEPAPEPSARPAVEAPPEPEPVPVAAEPSTPAPAPDRPEEPIFPGLGSAVVSPPPGYDPTNPRAWKARVEAQSAAAQQKPDAAEERKPARGRRRVAAQPAGPGRQDRRGRPGRSRGRRAPVQRKRRKDSGASRPSTVAPKASKRKIRMDNVISVKQLAHELGLKAPMVIKQLMAMGMMVRVNDMLDVDTATLVASEFEYEVENVGFQEENLLQHVPEAEEEENLQPRPPVVTIMGHVDHGKTTLLDSIRNTRVAQGEAGGITQHIGAYQVVHEGQVITFIDTPGHAAFTSMRARGASVTDIVVLVVAADDGIQPQTEEAISHSKAAGVPIIVAVNKMDKAGVKAEPIMQRLSEYELTPEEWGGETQVCPISALKGDGIEDILEAITLQAELLDLGANPDRAAEGVVIEAQMERGRGPVATVLVQKGTLGRNDHLVIGTTYGKVRAMTDFKGKRLKEAGPSTPVSLFGLSELPETGDVLSVVKTEKDARTLAEHRQQAKRDEALQPRRRTAEDLFAAAARAQLETLNIILKADVQGSLEAVRGALLNLPVEGTELRILHAAVGNISESDVQLAASDAAVLIGFNVRPDAKARRSCDDLGVEPMLYNVIYTLLDYVKVRLSGLLEPEYEPVDQGVAEVRAIFTISRVGTIAGCYVTEGTIGRNHHARLVRGNKQIWEGRMGTLKRFKDDVREVESGYECGISLDGYNDIKEGDLIQTYTMEEVPLD